MRSPAPPGSRGHHLVLHAATREEGPGIALRATENKNGKHPRWRGENHVFDSVVEWRRLEARETPWPPHAERLADAYWAEGMEQLHRHRAHQVEGADEG